MLVFHQHLIIPKAFCGQRILGNAELGESEEVVLGVTHHFSDTVFVLVTAGEVYSCCSL